MNKKFKLLSFLVAGIICFGMFAGCNKDNDDSNNAKTKNEKELIVWSHLMQNEVDEVNKVAQEWAKKNNRKVKVVKDESDFKSFLQAANSTKGPDIMYGIAHDTLGQFAKANLLSEVPSGMINKDDYDNPEVLNTISYEGKDYAIPLAMETYALFYNKDKVKEVPKTMDDLIKQAQAFGGTGFQYDINNFYYSAAIIQSYGGYIFGMKDGKYDINDVGLNNEGALKGYQFLQDLVVKYKFMKPDITGDIAKANFQSGKSIFYISGPWDVDAFKKANVPFGIAPIPQINGQGAKSLMGVQAGFVSAKSKDQDGAWDLMKYLTENTPDKLFEVGNRIPVKKTDLEKDVVKNNENAKAFIEQLKTGVPMPNVSEVGGVWDAEKKIQIILNGEDVKTTADDIQKSFVDSINVASANKN